MAEPLHSREAEEQLCRALRAGTEEMLTRVALAYASEDEWCDRLRAAAYEMLRFLEEDHLRARQMVIDVLSAGEHAQVIRERGLQAMVELIDQGRWELDDPDSMSRAIAEGICGAINHRIHAAVAADRFEELEPMVSELMYTAVLPYLGTEAALRELAIPPLSRPVDKAVSQQDGRVPSG